MNKCIPIVLKFCKNPHKYEPCEVIHTKSWFYFMPEFALPGVTMTSFRLSMLPNWKDKNP